MSFSKISVRFRFDNFLLDPAGHRLLRDGEPRELPPKAFELLTYLVAHGGEVLSKRRLLDALWAGAAVVENTLAQRLCEVRAALGDDPSRPCYVETVPRVGYRFIAEVETLADRRAGIVPGSARPARSGLASAFVRARWHRGRRASTCRSHPPSPSA